MKKVRVRCTIEYDKEVEDSYTKDSLERYLNEVTCLDSVLEDVVHPVLDDGLCLCVADVKYTVVEEK